MSAPILLQNATGSITVYLELSAGGAATGLTFSDVTADLKKTGESSFTAMTLSGSNFTEIGSGFYELDFAVGDTDTLGNMYVRISGATIKLSLSVAFVAATAPVNPTTINPPNTSELFGFVYGPDAAPVAGASVSVKLLSPPQVLSSSDPEGFGVTTNTLTTKTDAEGFFTITVTEGLTVDFAIPALSYRRTLVVPAANSNVFDLA